MRLLVVAPWGERLGGAEGMLSTWLGRLSPRDHDVTVAFLAPGPLALEIAALGHRAAVVEAGRLRDARRFAATVRRLRHLIDERDPDVVLSWSAKCQLYVAPAAVLAGRSERLVWWQHELPRGHWMDRLATALPARAVGCSSAAAEAAQRALRPRRETFSVHPGIELPADPGPRPAGDSGGPVTIGIVGRLHPRKGQAALLEAVALLSGRGHDVRALIVGGEASQLSSGYEQRLRRLIDERGLAARTTLTGHSDEVDRHLRAMDVFVNAREDESFGIVVTEAMAARLPVVAVGRGGPAEIVQPGLTGLLVEEARPDLLATALETLVVDGDLRARMGAAGRARCVEAFGAATMAERIVAELTQAVGSNTSP